MIPDYRSLITLLTALAVVVQQALPGSHWSTAATVVLAAVLNHTAPTSTSTRTTSSPSS